MTTGFYVLFVLSMHLMSVAIYSRRFVRLNPRLHNQREWMRGYVEKHYPNERFIVVLAKGMWKSHKMTLVAGLVSLGVWFYVIHTEGFLVACGLSGIIMVLNYATNTIMEMFLVEN